MEHHRHVERGERNSSARRASMMAPQSRERYEAKLAKRVRARVEVILARPDPVVNTQPRQARPQTSQARLENRFSPRQGAQPRTTRPLTSMRRRRESVEVQAMSPTVFGPALQTSTAFRSRLRPIATRYHYRALGTKQKWSLVDRLRLHAIQIGTGTDG